VAESKCKFNVEGWRDNGGRIDEWIDKYCSKITAAMDEIANNKDLIKAMEVHTTKYTNQSSYKDGGWGYVGHVTYGESGYDNLFSQIPTSFTPEQVADLKSEQWGALSLQSLATLQKMFRTTLEKDGSLKTIMADWDTGIKPTILKADKLLGWEDASMQKFVKQINTAVAQDPVALQQYGLQDFHYDPAGNQSLQMLDTQLQGAYGAVVHPMKAQLDIIEEAFNAYNAIEKEEKGKLNAAIKVAERDIKDKCTRNLSGECNMSAPGVKEAEAKLAALKEELSDWNNWAGAGREGVKDMVGDMIPPSQAGKIMKRTFKEQCLLLSNIYKISHYKVYNVDQKNPQRLPYVADATGSYNACVMGQREPWGFLNQLTQDKDYKTFFDIKASELSQLSPMIKLYKIESGLTGPSDERTVPITFDTHYDSTQDFDNILKNKDKRGFGVGLKSFNFSYEGSNPFAIKKSIKAKLVIFASSFDDLLVSRGKGIGGFRYADLALKTGGKLQELLDRSGRGSSAVVNNISKLNFRLKAVVGWHLPNNKRFGRLLDQSAKTSLQNAVYNSFVTLNLTPTIHEFDIDEQGRVLFTINYLAYIEDFFDQPNFNIFAEGASDTRALKRRLEIAAFEEHCDEKEAADKKKKEYEKIVDEKVRGMHNIIKKMLDQKKVYFVPIPYDQLSDFNKKGPFFDFKLAKDIPAVTNAPQKDRLTTLIEARLKGVAEKVKTDKDLTSTPMNDLSQNEYIKFFYLSDLVNVVLENIQDALLKSVESIGDAKAPSTAIGADDWDAIIASEKERLQRLQFNFKHFRVLLGPVEIYDFGSGAGKNDAQSDGITLGDLPISVSYFMNWLSERVMKRDSSIYTLSAFLNDLLNGLVRNFLNEDRCHDLNIKQKTRVFQSVVTSYNNWSDSAPGIDEMTLMIQKQQVALGENVAQQARLFMKDIGVTAKGMRTQGLLDVMGVRNSPITSKQPTSEYNYLVYYAGRVQPVEEMQGLYDRDAANGIWHYKIGKPNGIVKTIQLTKTDSPGLKEVRFEQEGYDGLAQLREVYDATITCYGSPNIVPGTYIYIDPKGFAPTNHNGQYKYQYSDAKGNKFTIDPMQLTRYGIGGYYMVIKAENKLAPGEFNTTITAKWVAQTVTAQTKSRPGPRPSKCQVK
jgi:hypothetical protein